MIEKHDMWYAPHEGTRTLHIWLPDDYYADGNEERYPVTYFFDGQNLFSDNEATYGTSWGLADFLRSWEKPMIVVGLECSHVGNERLDEYCPWSLKIMDFDVHGIGEKTFQWIMNDIKPWVDAIYRTWPHREATAIAGSSMGGIMSVYGVLAHNDVFSKAGCISSGCHFMNRFFVPLANISDISSDTRAYFAWAEGESGKIWGEDLLEDSDEAAATQELATILRNEGAATSLWCIPGGQHNEASWATQNRRCFDFLWCAREDGPDEA